MVWADWSYGMVAVTFEVFCAIVYVVGESIAGHCTISTANYSSRSSRTQD